MAISEGHQFAIEQLKKIESHHSGAIEIVSIASEPNANGWLTIEISVDCSEFPSVPGGLSLNHRERVLICVPSDFPFSAPSTYVLHTRFALFSHVQWGIHLCLYASDLQWNANDGMFGYIHQLGEWFRRGALNELDETGEPLHPPSTFVGEKSEYSVCVDIDLPKSDDTIYKCAAILSRLNSKTFEISGWRNLPLQNNDDFSAVLILKEKVPFEFPETVWMLFQLLQEKGIEISQLFQFLKEIAIRKKTRHPMLLFICTPMIGIKGSGEAKYHVSCWEIDYRAANNLRTIGKISGISKKQDKKRKDAIDAFFDWASSAKVKWCTVFDNRPETTVRRDYLSPVRVFKDKNIIVWGCGALGANVSIHLARAGVKKLTLIDEKNVTPGVLVRQPFHRDQCGINKATALKEIINKIDRKIEIEALESDISDYLKTPENIVADILIDCTASNKIHLLAEKQFKDAPIQIPVISMCFDNGLKNGLAICIGGQYGGSFYDAYRKSFISGCSDEDTRNIIGSFISPESKLLFQPIPGCSEPTFTGASTDTAILSAKLLNSCADILLIQEPSSATSIVVPENGAAKIFPHKKDICVPDSIQDYSVHITDSAWKQILEVIKTHSKKNGRTVETGGLLYGERNDILKTVWIDIATPPPPDSKASETKFECGIQGVKENNIALKEKYFGCTKAIGSWHTHPKSMPYPSETDILGIGSIFFMQDCNREKHLLIIIQPQAKGEPRIGAHLFSREKFRLESIK